MFVWGSVGNAKECSLSSILLGGTGWGNIVQVFGIWYWHV